MTRRKLAAAALCAVTLAGCGGRGGTEPGPSFSDAGGVPHAELGLPNGPTTGVVLLIHGGGWAGPMPGLTAEQRPAARLLQDEGYATLIVDYRAGRRGLDDVLQRYDEARRRFPGLPICLHGQSAGGHLALMVAARRSDVACVISQAGPTDLEALRREARGVPSYRWAVQAFGRDRLREYSPVEFARDIRAPVLQVAARNDRYVPWRQASEMQSRLTHGRLVVLPKGSVQFVHSRVDARAARRAVRVEDDFLADAMAP